MSEENAEELAARVARLETLVLEQQRWISALEQIAMFQYDRAGHYAPSPFRLRDLIRARALKEKG